MLTTRVKLDSFLSVREESTFSEEKYPWLTGICPFKFIRTLINTSLREPSNKSISCVVNYVFVFHVVDYGMSCRDHKGYATILGEKFTSCMLYLFAL